MSGSEGRLSSDLNVAISWMIRPLNRPNLERSECGIPHGVSSSMRPMKFLTGVILYGKKPKFSRKDGKFGVV